MKGSLDMERGSGPGPTAETAAPPGRAPSSAVGSAAEAATIRLGDGGPLIGARVSPSSRRTVFRGLYGDRLKIAVSAPPEDNRANQELTAALAKWFKVPRDAVRVESGHASRDKVILFAGMEESELRRRLEELLVVGGPPEG